MYTLGAVMQCAIGGSTVDDDLVTMIASMMQTTPTNRPSFDDILRVSVKHTPLMHSLSLFRCLVKC